MAIDVQHEGHLPFWLAAFVKLISLLYCMVCLPTVKYIYYCCIASTRGFTRPFYIRPCHASACSRSHRIQANVVDSAASWLAGCP